MFFSKNIVNFSVILTNLRSYVDDFTPKIPKIPKIRKLSGYYIDILIAINLIR